MSVRRRWQEQRQVTFPSIAILVLGYATAAGGTTPPAGKASDQKTKTPTAPSIDLVIAAGAAGDAKLEHGVYIFHLKCSDTCDLDRLTLNECSNTKEHGAQFVPRISQWSSSTKNLEIVAVTDHTLELVVYQAFERLLPAKMVFTFDPAAPAYETLTGFKTQGFIDARAWPKIRTLIDYVPLQTDTVKALDCPIALRGLRH